MKNVGLYSLLIFFFIIGKQYYCQNTEISQLDGKIKIIIDSDELTKQRTFYVDESVPGSPILSSKVYYIAIPAGSKINASLDNKKITLTTIDNPEINNAVEKENDSTLKYIPQELQDKYLHSETYPAKLLDVLGYCMIGDYYCAIIKINNETFNWRKKELSRIDYAELNVQYEKGSQVANKTYSGSDYEKGLDKIIFNYKMASQFRTNRNNLLKSKSSDNWPDYSQNYAKIAIPSNGIYQIKYNDFEKYGVNPSTINPGKLKIYNKGHEIPVYIKTKVEGAFGPGDYAEFWGEINYSKENYQEIVKPGSDYKNFMNKYNDTSFYWITWEGEDGKRISEMSYYSANADTLLYYQENIHLEKDNRIWYYDAVLPRVQLPFFQENKIWSWDLLGDGSYLQYNLPVSDIVPNSEVSFIARFISYSANIQLNAHKVGLSINSDIILDTMNFDFKSTVNFKTSVNASKFLAANNYLKLWGIKTESSFQQILLDWIDVSYLRKLSFQRNSLYFKLPAKLTSALRNIKIDNIPADQIDSLVILKISDNPIKVSYKKNGSSSIVFADSASGEDAYFITLANSVKSPDFRYSKKFVNLRSFSRGADYILISHKALSPSVVNYNQFIRSNYKVRTELIYIDDIFDEFAYGYNEPEAIREFLKTTHTNWISPKPLYVNLVGHANYDYKDQWFPVPAVRKKNLVPSFGYPVSDVWFTMFDSSKYETQQMYIGRIPAADNSEVNNYLEKHMRYLNRKHDDWNKNVVLFSGGETKNPDELLQIRKTNDDVFANLVIKKPFIGSGIHLYKTINPPSIYGPYSPETVQNTINEGGIIVSYVGHSATQTWDNGITAISHLKNKYSDRFPLISDFGCSTGRFAEPDIDAFSELAVCSSPDGQAIAYLGNSSWGYTSTSFRFPSIFYNLLIKDSVVNVGRLHFLAKMTQFKESGYSEVNRVFNYNNLLFGDPIININIPVKPNIKLSDREISLLNTNPTELDENAVIKLPFHNTGRAIEDSVTVFVTDIVNNVQIYETEIKVKANNLVDTLLIKIPIRKTSGQHIVKVIADPLNKIDEILKDDNNVNFLFNVYSASVRPLVNEIYYNAHLNSVNCLNPSRKDKSETVKLLLSKSPEFLNAIEIVKPFDSVFTKITLPQLEQNQRYYWKISTVGTEKWSGIHSFKEIQNDFNWFYDKPDTVWKTLSFNTSYNFLKSGWELDKSSLNIKIGSAGFNDGSFASILYQGNEVLTNTLFWGIVTARLDSATFKPVEIKYFVYPNPPSADSLVSYLNSLKQGSLVAFSICDDGPQAVLDWSANSPARNAIKVFGSKYIDSVKYRESWCMIGKKGAPVGTVKESYKKLFQGPASVDTSIAGKREEGYIVFPGFKNINKLYEASFSYDLPAGSRLEIYPLGVRDGLVTDTMPKLALAANQVSLSGINASLFTEVKLMARLFASPEGQSPVVKSFGIKYVGNPELALNYQSVSVSQDSVERGVPVNLDFALYNIGESGADSFKVKVEAIKPDNSREIVGVFTVDSLQQEKRKKIHLAYNTSSGDGQRAFSISVDPENKIRELFEDNNFFTIPFYIKPDSSKPSLKVTFDGADIFNGEYISSTPEIRAEISDNSHMPVSDTTSVRFILNNKPVYYTTKDVIISYNESNPKAVAIFKPFLHEGIYTLNVIGKNALGNSTDSSAYIRNFIVDNNLKVLDLYNYPNPFKNDTYFTFKLPQIPEIMRIKIYSVAGRMIKNIEIRQNELKYDFNKIYWDGRDQDGDLLANGTYFYKVTLEKEGKSENYIRKLAIIR